MTRCMEAAVVVACAWNAALGGQVLFARGELTPTQIIGGTSGGGTERVCGECGEQSSVTKRSGGRLHSSSRRSPRRRRVWVTAAALRGGEADAVADAEAPTTTDGGDEATAAAAAATAAAAAKKARGTKRRRKESSPGKLPVEEEEDGELKAAKGKGSVDTAEPDTSRVAVPEASSFGGGGIGGLLSNLLNPSASPLASADAAAGGGAEESGVPSSEQKEIKLFPALRGVIPQIFLTVGSAKLVKMLPNDQPTTIRKARIIFCVYFAVFQVVSMVLRVLIWKKNDQTMLEIPPPQKMMELLSKSIDNTEIQGMVQKPLTRKVSIKAYDMGVIDGLRRSQVMQSVFMTFLHMRMGMIKPIVFQAVYGTWGLLNNPLVHIYLLGRKAEGRRERPFRPPAGMKDIQAFMAQEQKKMEASLAEKEAAAAAAEEAAAAAEEGGGDNSSHDDSIKVASTKATAAAKEETGPTVEEDEDVDIEVADLGDMYGEEEGDGEEGGGEGEVAGGSSGSAEKE